MFDLVLPFLQYQVTSSHLLSLYVTLKSQKLKPHLKEEKKAADRGKEWVWWRMHVSPAFKLKSLIVWAVVPRLLHVVQSVSELKWTLWGEEGPPETGWGMWSGREPHTHTQTEGEEKQEGVMQHQHTNLATNASAQKHWFCTTCTRTCTSSPQHLHMSFFFLPSSSRLRVRQKCSKTSGVAMATKGSMSKDADGWCNIDKNTPKKTYGEKKMSSYWKVQFQKNPTILTSEVNDTWIKDGVAMVTKHAVAHSYCCDSITKL